MTNPNMTEELKPCPFCGSDDVDIDGWMAVDERGLRRTGPACDECGATAASAEAWNKRAG